MTAESLELRQNRNIKIQTHGIFEDLDILVRLGRHFYWYYPNQTRVIFGAKKVQLSENSLTTTQPGEPTNSKKRSTRITMSVTKGKRPASPDSSDYSQSSRGTGGVFLSILPGRSESTCRSNLCPWSIRFSLKNVSSFIFEASTRRTHFPLVDSCSSMNKKRDLEVFHVAYPHQRFSECRTSDSLVQTMGTMNKFRLKWKLEGGIMWELKPEEAWKHEFWDKPSLEFDILFDFGKGAFGEVKDGIDLITNERIAIKIIKKEDMLGRPGGTDFIDKELEIMKTLQASPHPNVCRFLRKVETKTRVVLS